MASWEMEHLSVILLSKLPFTWDFPLPCLMTPEGNCSCSVLMQSRMKKIQHGPFAGVKLILRTLHFNLKLSDSTFHEVELFGFVHEWSLDVFGHSFPEGVITWKATQRQEV